MWGFIVILAEYFFSVTLFSMEGMESLNKLFGGAGIVKILKLFLMNQDSVLSTKEIAKRTKIDFTTTKREINMLKGIDFCKQKVAVKNERRVRGWQLNPLFPHIRSLKNLLVDSALYSNEELIKRFKNVGRVKLVIVSGVFLKNEGSRVDIMLVGDRLKKSKIEQVIKKIESEIGKELIYAIVSTKDYSYRLGAYDKFLRDILDNPHQKIIDKIEAEV